MFRTAILFPVLALGLACTPGGGLGPPSASDCRLILANHCDGVCKSKGGVAVGYLAVIPANQFRCVCKLPEEEKPGFVF